MLLGAGELVTHWSVIEQFDRHITSWVVAHRSHALDATMKVITWCGSWVAVAVTGGLLLVLVAVHRLPLAVVILAAAGWVGEVTAVNLVKTLVDRRRPPQGLWLVSAHGGSFPSGHAANAMLVFATLALVWCILAVLSGRPDYGRCGVCARSADRRVLTGRAWCPLDDRCRCRIPRGCRMAGRHRSVCSRTASHFPHSRRPRREAATERIWSPRWPWQTSPEVVGPED